MNNITTSVGEPMQREIGFSEFKDIFNKYGFGRKNHLNPVDVQTIYLKNSPKLKAYENVHFLTVVKEI